MWRRLVSTLSIAGTLSLAGARAADQSNLVYDSDFGGYVPIVDGIQRPDLVTTRDEGRVPEDASVAARRTRRSLAGRAGRSGWTYADDRPRDTESSPKPGAHWLRRWGTTIDLTVTDRSSRPVRGARVYLAADPAFYAVNVDETGARLFGSYRFLPYPYPDQAALADAQRYDELWESLGDEPARQERTDITLRRNPWLREDQSITTPPLEFVGATNVAGALRVVSGVFNTRNEKRFPRAIAPEAFKLHLVVIAPGRLPAVASFRFSRPGLREPHTIILLDAPDWTLFSTAAWSRALWRADAISLAENSRPEAIAAELAAILAGCDTNLLLVPEEQRGSARVRAEALLWLRLAQRAPSEMTAMLLQRAVDLEPSASRLYRLARVLDQPEAATAALRQALKLDPAFGPAYLEFDRSLAPRKEAASERKSLAESLLQRVPFDRWARARLAALELAAEQPGNAFDHLRYSWGFAPRLGRDRELAEALFDYFWRHGVPEKAGMFLWLLSGNTPEDPTRGIRR